MPQRTLSEGEFNTLREALISQAPQGLSESDFNNWFGSRMAAAVGQAESSPAPVSGGSLRRFVGGAAEYLNPISIASGLYQGVRHPIDTGVAALSQMGGQLSQAKDLYGQGRLVEAGGHAAAGVLPFIGPSAAKAGEAIASGDVAGGMGQATGLLAPVLIPAAVRGVMKATSKVAEAVPTVAETAADTLEQGAASRVADVMSPKVGANKVRIGNQAQKVAPSIAKDLATEGAPFSRSGLATQIEGKLTEAEQALDAASNARNPNIVVHTAPVIRDLEAKLGDVTAQTHRLPGMKAGADVIPGPNVARAAPIQQAIDEIQQLGPVANYEALRRIRQAYDAPAKAVYSPAVTADYLKAQGSKMGAADVTGVLRDTLAKMDPQAAEANATYSLYRTASDVLKAAEETERARPKVGRVIMARLTGALIGESAAGAKGAIAGFIGGPILDSALNAGATTKLQTAAMMQRLANAVRSGDVSAVDSVLGKLKNVAKTANTGTIIDQATSPSGSRTGQEPMPVTP